jgi:hypothetical protein
MKRTLNIFLLLFLLIASISSEARGTTKKSYINMYVLVMDCTERSMVWVEKHKDDPSLASVALALAETNIKLLQDISPPKAFIEIHPHLISIVENSANAFEAAANGSPASFYSYKKNMQKERKALFEVMRELNFVFPTII